MLLRNNSLVEEIQDSVASNISGGTGFASDFNGDGRSDLAVVRIDGGNWRWLINFTPETGPLIPATAIDIPFGTPADTPITGDYNADGSTDIGFVTPTLAWNIDTNLDGAADLITTWGLPFDRPVGNV